MPIFFQPVELPDHCFLSEAVEFLAFGRVPLKQSPAYPPKDENGEYQFDVDVRFLWQEMPDNFEWAESDWRDLFSEFEFELCGIEMPEDYSEIGDRYLMGDLSSASSKLETYELLKHLDFDSETREQLENDCKQAELLLKENEESIKIFLDTNAKFDRFLDIAWAKIFQGIQSERFQVEAIDLENWNALADRREYKKAAEFVSMPPEAFALKHDYLKDQVEHASRQYVATRVQTTEVVQLLDLTEQSTASLSVTRFGATLVSGSATPKVSNRRGAPHKVNWQLVSDYLEELAESGQVPAKKEACIALVQEFCRKNFEKRVGRTTVQTRLGVTLDRIIAQN